MKKVVLTLSILLLTIKTMAQSATDFYGEWKVQKFTEQPQQWSLKKTKPKEASDFRDWGQFFQFNEDSTYSEYASAPCGLDDHHYRYDGKWIYHPDSGIIELKDIKVGNDRPNIYMDYKVLSSGSMKVTVLKKEVMEITIINHWEKTSNKN